MKKTLFFIPLLVFAADINPFGAGNINSNNPYGLTPQEKAIVNNKKNISKLQIEIKKLKSSLDAFKLKINNDEEVVNSKLSALDTILDELAQDKKNYISLKLSIKNLENRINDINETIINLKNNFNNLNNKINNMQNNLTTLNDAINSVINNQNKNMEYVKKAISDIYKQIKNLNKPLSAKEAFNKARNLFFAGKLDKAREYFLYSLSKKHLPATSAYYLGEIAFKKHNYQKALAYYKKSVNFYPKKTSFTSRLLYHTAISFEKLGDTQSAKLTLQKVISDFPSSKYANLAKKELEKLK